MKEAKEIDLKPLVSNLVVRTLDFADGKLLVGSSTGDIIQYAGGNSDILLQGHGKGELWGLGTHSSKNFFVTARFSHL